VARRLARLLPAYYLALFLMTAYEGPVVAWFAHATLTVSLYPLDVCASGDAHLHNIAFLANPMGWFTSVIVLLCFCFPPLFNVISVFGSGVSFALLVMMALLRGYITFHHDVYPSTSYDYHMFVAHHLCAFLLGMICSQVCKKATNIMTSRIWVWVFDGLFASFIVVHLYPGASMYGLLEVQLGVHLNCCIDCLFCISSYGMAMSAGTRRGDSILDEFCNRGIMGNILGSRLAVELAQYSFSAYILQFPVFFALKCVMDMVGGSTISWWVYLVLLWATSVLVTSLFEKPAQKAMETWIAHDRTETNK